MYTRALLLKYPYEDDASPFVSAHKRQMRVFPSGHRVALADDAVQYHAYGGWPFILDLRKNKGLQYQIMRSYLSDTTPNALQKLWWPIRMLLGGLRDDFILLTHFFGKYCKPSDIFLAVIYPFFTRPIEILGAVQAYAGKDAVEGSAYR